MQRLSAQMSVVRTTQVSQLQAAIQTDVAKFNAKGNSFGKIWCERSEFLSTMMFSTSKSESVGHRFYTVVAIVSRLVMEVVPIPRRPRFLQLIHAKKRSALRNPLNVQVCSGDAPLFFAVPKHSFDLLRAISGLRTWHCEIGRRECTFHFWTTGLHGRSLLFTLLCPHHCCSPPLKLLITCAEFWGNRCRRIPHFTSNCLCENSAACGHMSCDAGTGFFVDKVTLLYKSKASATALRACTLPGN